MLGTVLERITGLFGRAFFIAALLPIVLFLTANAAAIGSCFGWSKLSGWWNDGLDEKSVQGALLLVSVVAASYLAMIVSPILKRVAEGQYALGWPGKRLRRRRIDSFNRARAAVAASTSELKAFREDFREFKKRLQLANNARREPAEIAPSVTPQRKPVPPPENSTEIQEELLAEASKSLADIQCGVAPASSQTLRPLAGKLEQLYMTPVPLAQIEPIHFAFTDLCNDTETAMEYRYSEALGDMDSRFDRSSGVAGVRPTTLGNIIGAIWAYPFTRYGIDAVGAWPPLQHVIPEKYYPTVEDARISYDFAVMTAFLSGVFGVGWLGLGLWLWWNGTGCWPPPPGPFVATVAGVLGAIVMRLVAVEAARSFGAVFRTCFDLFRFDLLKKLSIPIPKNLEEERTAWSSLNQVLSYGDHSKNLVYEHSRVDKSSVSDA